MKIKLIVLFILVCSFGFCNNFAKAIANSQIITIKNGWNIISTSRIVESHSFSTEENSSNFDIYILDPNSTSKWSTMAQLNQTEFTPLFGYFINNKTSQDQTLTLNYKNNLLPNERIFEREFSKVGWYSVGGANPTYIKTQNANTIDTNNVNQVFDSIKDKMDLFIDFTDQDYASNRKSVAINTNWKSAISNDLNSINDIRETKGYAVYINDTSAKLMGFQNNDTVNSISLLNYSSDTVMTSQLKKGDTNKVILATQVEANNSNIVINSVEVNLSGTSIQPWKTFDSFGLYIDNQLVKSIDATQSNFIENTADANYTLTFADLQNTIQKDSLTDLVIKVDMKNSLENESNYTFKFLEGSIKGEDSLNAVKSTNTVITNSTTLDLTIPGTISFSLNPASPKMGYILGSSTATSADKPITIFDVKAENRDVTIRTLKVTMTDIGGLVSAVKLYDGATLLSSVAGANGDVTFSNLVITIAKDTTKSLTIKVDLKPIDGITITEGLSLIAAISANDTKITAIDSSEDTLTTDNMSNNTITGGKQTAYTKAPTFTLVSSNIVKTTQAGSNDIADATIVVNVTANGGDIYFKKTADAGDSTEAFVVNKAGGAIAEANYTYTTNADAYDANFFVVRNGETKSFTITGRISGGNIFEQMSLITAKWSVNSDGSSPVTTTTAYDFADFKTTSVYLANA